MGKNSLIKTRFLIKCKYTLSINKTCNKMAEKFKRKTYQGTIDKTKDN